MGILGIIFAALFVVKVAGLASISWWLVVAPLAVWAVLAVAAVAGTAYYAVKRK